MSRTYRNPGTRQHCFRRPVAFNFLKESQSYLDELREIDFVARNRDRIKGNPYNHGNAYDDKQISASYELDFSKNKTWN